MPTRRTPLHIGEEFTKLQETRVKTYAQLNEAHKEYLTTGPNYQFKKYQTEVADATEAFKTISSKVISLKKEVEGTDIESFIGQIQEHEEKKLRTTVKLQLARQKVQDSGDNQDKHDDALEEVRIHLQDLNERIEDINDCMEEIRYILADMREELERDSYED